MADFEGEVIEMPSMQAVLDGAVVDDEKKVSDDLRFSKGDRIVVTKKCEYGSWWGYLEKDADKKSKTHSRNQ